MKCLLLSLALLVGDFQSERLTAESEAAFQFAVARSLAEEGSVDEALDAWAYLLAMDTEDAYVRIEYARFLTRIGRFPEAVREVERARDLAPENPDVLRAAADIYLSAKRVDETHLELAIQSFEELIAVRPEDVQALVDLGRVLLVEVGEPQRAAEVFARAVALQPASRMLQSYLVEALLRASERSEAERSLEAFLETDAAFLRGRLLLSNQQSQRSDHHAAVETLRQAPASQADDRELRWQLASELYRTGELEEGVRLLEGLLEEQPDTFKERALKGMMLAAQGSNDEAIEVFEVLRRDRPDNVEITRALVRALERTGRDRQAEELLRQASRGVDPDGDSAIATTLQVELLNHLMRSEAWKKLTIEARPLAEDEESPLHVQGFLMYVEALRRAGRGEKALEVLATANSARVPVHRVRSKEVEILADLDRIAESEAELGRLAQASDLPSLLAAAEVYQRQQRYADAVPVLARALERADDSIHVRYWLGAAYERSGDRQRAAEMFRALLAVDPGYAPALNYLGYMWAEQGVRLDEAAELVDRAVAQEPENGAYVDSLGWVHYQLGDDEAARVLLERAARLMPEDGVIYVHLGDVYARSGQSERARESYRRALQLDVENEGQVRAKLERLSNGR